LLHARAGLFGAFPKPSLWRAEFPKVFRRQTDMLLERT
jgi:hypothetical protein